MSSELQLDVCCRSCCGGDIWWTRTKERQAWCCLQVKPCDPCLSALCVPWCKKALYKYSSFPFLSVTLGWGLVSLLQICAWSAMTGSRNGKRDGAAVWWTLNMADSNSHIRRIFPWHYGSKTYSFSSWSRQAHNKWLAASQTVCLKIVTHYQVLFRKSLSKVTFERKLARVSGKLSQFFFFRS